MRRIILSGLLVAALTLAACGPAPSADGPPDGPYDVILRGGRVLDGSGNPWYRADVAIRGQRIAAVGDLDGASAVQEVDVRDLYVAPGFIDTHSHAGNGLTTEELSGAVPLLAQGITTVLVNPDGGGEANLLTQREALEVHGLGVNVGQLVPHGQVRETVMGLEDLAPTPQQMDLMRSLVRAGMEEGAFGLSSGLFYTPGGFARIDEVVALGHVVAEFNGAYQSHIRDESTYSIGLLAAVDEVITVAEEAGIRGVVTHIKALGPEAWGMARDVITLIEEARARGVEVFADHYPYPAGSTGLRSALVPKWAQEGGEDALRERLRDPEISPRVRAGMTENLARRGGAARIQFREVESAKSLEGGLLSEFATARGIDPVSAAIELLLEGSPSIVSHSMREDDVRAFMALPWTMTASDGGLDTEADGVPHPRSYGAFTRKLAVYARDEGVVDLASAVRSMTSLPATVFRMADRGVLRPGAVADLVVFDLARLRTDATFGDPRNLAEGVAYLWVNGAAAVDDGEVTGILAGQVLQRSHRP
jgi:N-acyl-D-aspartate/D-glutamate deacylase